MSLRQYVSLTAISALIASATPHQHAVAVVAPRVVVEASLALGVPINSIAIDSTSSDKPILVIGTDSSFSGKSYILRIDPQVMQLIDTAATFGSPIRKVCVGFLNADQVPDYLIAIDSMIVRMINGPLGWIDTIPILVDVPRTYWAGVDTITMGGQIRDMVIDEANRSFFVGFSIDAVMYAYPETWQWSSGGIRHFQSLAYSGTDIYRGDNVLDLTLNPVEPGSHHRIIGFWKYNRGLSMPTVGCEPNIHRLGCSAFNADGLQTLSQTLFSKNFSEGGADLSFSPPVPVADMNGDGIVEFVHANHFRWWSLCNAGWGNAYFASAYTLGLDSALWTVDGQWTASLWELDGDGLPDVLLHGNGITIGVKGSTGDSLFSIETEDSFYPEVQGSFRNDSIQRGILVTSDTLVMYRLDFGADASGDSPLLPGLFELHPVYPNPFNASATVRYTLSALAHVTVTVHDILGRRIRILVRESLPQGEHTLQWNGRTDSGQETGSGVYFIKVEAEGYEQTRKILYLK